MRKLARVEAELEQCLHGGAALFQGGDELSRRHPPMVDARRSFDAVLAPKRLDPHTAGVVKGGSDGADGAARRSRRSKVPKLGREPLDELGRAGAVSPPGGEQTCTKVRVGRHLAISLPQARAPALHTLFSILHGFLFCELELKLRHTHFSAAEFYAFHFQTEALIQGVLTWRGDPSSSGHNPVPGQAMRLPQHADYEARSARKTGGLSDRTIARDLAARDLHDGGAYVERILL